MSRYTRRQFLAQSTAAAAILGFPLAELLAVEPAADKPKPDAEAILEEARKRMKEDVKPGVVVVLRGDTRKLASDLTMLLGGHDEKCSAAFGPRVGKGMPAPIGSGDESARAIFCQAVFVCLPADKVKEVCRDLKDDAAIVVLDLAGKPVEQIQMTADLFGKDFTAKMTEVLHGKDGTCLEATVKSQKDALGNEAAEKVEKALKDLDADDFETRARASEMLEKVAPRTTAILAKSLRSEPSAEVKQRIGSMLSNMYTSAAPDKPGARLPFGMQWVEKTVDPCPGCGLSSVPHPARKFLQFAGQKATE